MIVKTVSYETVRNLGNYENERLGIECEVFPGEDPHRVMIAARDLVEQGLAAIADARRTETQKEHEDRYRQYQERLRGFSAVSAEDDANG